MGSRGEHELTAEDDDLAATEAATRALLARFGEPTQALPPPGLARRLVAGLPRNGLGPQLAHPWRRFGIWAGAVVAALLLALGAWGVLVNSLGPARVAAGITESFGQLVLVLTLAAKPLVNLLADAGLIAAVAVALSVFAAGFWWRLVRNTPLALPVEVQE